MIKIAIGCDHAGVELKDQLLPFLKGLNLDVSDKGTFGSESVDYPDFAHQVAKAVAEKEVEFGMLICGSANGVSMTANKYSEVRAAIAWLPEIAALAKQHNNANVLCLPARFISEKMAKEIVEAYVENEFEGGRHDRRVQKIAIC